MLQKQPLKLTLDTNCIINYFDNTAETPTSVADLNELIRLGLSNKVEVKITTRVEADLLRDPDSERKQKMLKVLDIFPIIGTVARLDITRLDRGDFLSGDNTKSLVMELQRIIFPGLAQGDKRYINKLCDIDHLAGHILNQRDIFVTDDKGILKRHDELKSTFGLIVMRPDECLSYVQRNLEKTSPRSIASEDINLKYYSPTLNGIATFDYSNNNGKYVIGKGQFSFETRWSKASDISIHAYSDSPNIECLALLKNSGPIKGVGDVSRLDYSSRVRSPSEGQIIIWRNTNGIYAATKIIDIKDESRSDDRDELTFEYIIQTDGTSIF